MTDDFGYLNARIRVRRSQLLHEGFFYEALKLSFAELLRTLAESIYGADLSGDDLAGVDRAVTLHLNRTVGDLPRMVSGDAREAVSLLLMRSDLANVKTILSGKKKGWSAEEIMGRLLVGTLPHALYGVLMEAPDIASLAQLLSMPKHPLAGALREAASAPREALEAEMTLDRVFHTLILRRARELDQPYLVDFLSFEIDAMNLANGVKLFAVGFDGQLQSLFLPGGRHVGLSLFLRLAGGETAALEELGGTDFGRVSEAHDASTLERGLRCVLLAKAHEGGKDVLGVGVAVDFIQHKQWEAGRIRLLGRRAYHGLPISFVEREVFCQ